MLGQRMVSGFWLPEADFWLQVRLRESDPKPETGNRKTATCLFLVALLSRIFSPSFVKAKIFPSGGLLLCFLSSGLINLPLSFITRFGVSLFRLISRIRCFALPVQSH